MLQLIIEAWQMCHCGMDFTDKKANWLLLEAVFLFLFLFCFVFFFAFSLFLIFTYHYSKPTFLQMTARFELV